MTVQEVYDHITQHMTPEKALMKMLEGAVLQYEKLKFDKGEEVHPIMIIALAAMDMGWRIAVEKPPGDMRGIVVGTKEYMGTVYFEKDQVRLKHKNS